MVGSKSRDVSELDYSHLGLINLRRRKGKYVVADRITQWRALKVYCFNKINIFVSNSFFSPNFVFQEIKFNIQCIKFFLDVTKVIDKII